MVNPDMIAGSSHCIPNIIREEAFRQHLGMSGPTKREITLFHYFAFWDHARVTD